MPDEISQLGRLASAGRDHFDRLKELDPRYLTGMVEPVLSAAIGHIYPKIERLHILSEETRGATRRVTHYTSLSAATSMLRALSTGESAYLRLYDTAHANDPYEGNYLVNELSSASGYGWLAAGNIVGHAYITSFVGNEERDMSNQLYLWRTYGKEGSGCSLTLNVPSNLLRQVRYGPNGVADTKSLLLPVLEAVAPLAQAREDFGKALSRVILRNLEGVRYLYKHIAYENEKEYRAVLSAQSSNFDHSLVRFEPCESYGSLVRVRHYYELDELALEKTMTSNSILYVGPSVTDKYSVGLYLESLKQQAHSMGHRSHEFKIGVSDIPYNNR